MRAAVLFALTASLAAHVQAFAAEWRHLGTWSSVTTSKGNDPHVSGIEIELWQKGGKYAGYLSEYVGPAADPPVGKLEAIQLDEKSGAISFTVKLSVGVAPDPGGNAWVPTKNLYEFKGTIGEREMTGTLRRKSVQEDGATLAYDEDLTLASRPRGSDETFEQWSRRWSDALAKRGPKW